MLYVLENYLSSLQRQYYIGQPVSAGTKKPLNPFLGELFFCESTSADSKSHVKVICEQVSHHPPTTAAFISETNTGMTAEAYSTQQTSLSGTSVVVRQTGHALLKIPSQNETILMPFPDVYAKSILTGSPYPELSGTYKLFSSAGIVAEITFGGKSMNPFSSASKNHFEVKVYAISAPKEVFYTVSGIWSEKWTVNDKSGKEMYTTSLSDPAHQPAQLSVAPLDKQSPWESRRAWHDVATNLQSGTFQKALKAKSKLEDGQRDMRKKEKADGQTWERAFFVKCSEEEKQQGDLQTILKVAGKEVDIKSTLGADGCWRFDAEKERRFGEEGLKWPATPSGT